MTQHLIAGGSGANGRVSAFGKDDKPLAELIAGDAEAVISAGQKGGRPGRLTLYDGHSHGTFRAVIVLGRRHGGRGAPVAILGKVWCRVDASLRPIRSGDLLTTAPTAGHAMVAADRRRCTGAVLGKALRGFPSGTGLIPIL